MMSATLQMGFTAADPLSHLKDLQDRIRKEPARADLRVFLFQLYCLMGEWDKANNQLATLSELDKEAASMVQTYREALRCEVLRKEVFAGTKTPLLLGSPEDWVAWMIEALKLNASGHHAEARSLRDRAFEVAPAAPGKINGQDFAWIADADVRLGPMCEAILNGKYYWIPFSHVSHIAIEAPTDLRDYVWMPATLTFTNGGENVALIPNRYPGSESSTNSQIQLARRTEWMDMGQETFVGLGQRMFATDQGDYALMDVREIALGGNG